MYAAYNNLARRNMSYLKRGKVAELYQYPEDKGVYHLSTEVRTYPLAADMLRGLGFQSFGVGVDMGCGTVSFANHFQIGASYLFDVAFEYCKFMKAVQADVQRIPLPDDFADIAICSDILEHVIDFEAVIAEVERIIVPGGVLIVSIPYGAPITGLHVRKFDQFNIPERFRGWDILDARFTDRYKG